MWTVFKELRHPDEATEEWIYPKVPHYKKGTRNWKGAGDAKDTVNPEFRWLVYPPLVRRKIHAV